MLAAWRLFGVELGPLSGAGPADARHARSRNRLQFLYRASANKWWFDDINHLLFVVIGGRFADGAGLVRPRTSSTASSTASARSPAGAAAGLARVQTGRVQNYALGIALGLIAMAGSYFVILGR